MRRRFVLLATAAAATLALGGCAGFNTLTSEVTSFGQWPANRAPGSYFIERLPSQAARSARTNDVDLLETAARKAMEGRGFRPAADLASADVVVQVGARVTRYDVSPWHDPLWWRWGPTYWRGPVWAGTRWNSPTVIWRNAPFPEREVAVLLRDRATTTPLWEARAVSSGSGTSVEVFAAMFSAALSDFPNAQPQARSVSIPLAP